VELDDGNVLIDHEVANGERLAEDMRSLLIRKGFVEPDLRFVGRMTRSVPKREVVPPKCTDKAAGVDEQEVDIWSDDGLDEAKAEKDGLNESVTA